MATPQHLKCDPIRKSLLTPCRRVGLSRKVKPSSFNSPHLKTNADTPAPVKAVVNTVEAAHVASNTINHENTEIKKSNTFGLSRQVKPSIFNSPHLKANVDAPAVVNTIEAAHVAPNTINHENTEIKKSDTELPVKKGRKRKEVTVNASLNDAPNVKEINDCTSNKIDVYSVKTLDKSNANIDNVDTLEIQNNIENEENLNKDDVSVKRRRKPKKIDDMYIYTSDQKKKSPCKNVTLLTNKNNTRNKTSVSINLGDKSKTAVINVTPIDLNTLKDQNATAQKKSVKLTKNKMKVECKNENKILKTDEIQCEFNDIVETVEEPSCLKSISSEAAPLVDTEKQNENLAKAEKPKGLFKRLSMRKSTTTENLTDSEDFTTGSSPQSLPVNVDSFVDVFKSKKRKINSDDEAELEATSEDSKVIDAKTIAEIQGRIKTKKAHLEQLQRADMYKKMHNVEELRELIAIWRTGCNNALNQLHEKLQNHGPITMTQLMERLQVPSELLDVDLL